MATELSNRSPCHRAIAPLRQFLWSSTLALAAIALAVGSFADDGDEAQSELEETLDELNALDSWLGVTSSRLTKLQREVKRRDESIAEVSRQLDATSNSLIETRKAIGDLEVEQESLLAQRKKQAQRIAVHVRQAYRLSGQDFFKMLLSQENPDTFDRMIRYHGYFSKARADALQEYRSHPTEHSRATAN